MSRFERMIERFQLLLEIEYDGKRVERAVRKAAKRARVKGAAK